MMKKIMTTTEFADLVGLSTPTIRKLARSGQIPSFAVGVHVRVPVAPALEKMGIDPTWLGLSAQETASDTVEVG